MRAIITGASRGIGKAIATELAKCGVELVLTARRESDLLLCVKELAAMGAKVHALALDLADEAAPQKLLDFAIDKMGGVDHVINNAGLALSKSMEETTLEDWTRVMAINVRAPYFLCQACLPHLRTSKSPRIVNLASVVAHKGYVDQSLYTASKHALLGWSKSLAREVQAEGIRVHVVCPGGVDTEMVTGVRPDIDTSELISAKEIAEWVLFLLSREGNGVVDEVSIRRATKTAWD